MKKFSGLFILIILFSINLFADVKAPVTPKPVVVPKEITKDGEMVIMLTNRVDKPVLVIKKEMFEKLRAAFEGKTSSSILENSDINRTQTIVSGLFLSLAFVFGGVWLARNRGKVSKSAAAVVIFAVLGMTATFVTANVRPPKNYGLSSSIFSGELTRTNAYAEGKVKIIIGEGISDNDIELLFPRKANEVKNNEE